MLGNILAVAGGGAIGATLRYLASSSVTSLLGGASWAAALPLGTLAVNFAGCFVIGALSPALGCGLCPRALSSRCFLSRAFWAALPR